MTVTDGGTANRTLAAHGGEPARPAPIRTTVAVSGGTRREIDALLDEGFLSDYYNGPVAHRFEREFARRHGAGAHAVAVNSGTSALHLALAAAGVGPGDEVILPAACYVSAATAAVQLGATPVVCDIEEHSLTIDVDRVAELIGPRTKAVLPVHFWGQPSDLVRLRALCDEHGLTLVEDACQAPFATVDGRLVGSFGDFAAYSFGNRKHIATGEGGMVLARTEHDARRVRALSNVGKGPGWDDYESLGYSYRMVELSALIGLDGLARVDREITARRAAAAHYREVLAGTGLRPVPEPTWGTSVYFKLPVMLPEDAVGLRPALVSAIDAENVSCRVPHRPLYDIPWLAGLLRDRGRYLDAADCPVAARHLPRVFEVETGPNLPPEQAAVSAGAVASVWAAARSGALA